MTDPQAISHRLDPLASIPCPPPHDRPAENGLSGVELLPLTTGVSADLEGAALFWQQVNAWAGELADPEHRDEGRVRHLARMIAALRMKLLTNERRREKALLGDNSQLALVIDRMLQTDSRRLEGLLREHREGSRRGARTVHIAAVAIGQRPEVHVVATHGG